MQDDKGLMELLDLACDPAFDEAFMGKLILAKLPEIRAIIARLSTENEALAQALRDATAFMMEDISGPSQRSGIIWDALKALQGTQHD